MTTTEGKKRVYDHNDNVQVWNLHPKFHFNYFLKYTEREREERENNGARVSVF